MKNILLAVKAEINKDKEDNILLEGLKRLAEEQSQTLTLTMTSLVDTLKTRESKDSVSGVSEVRTARVTKPAKVPSWTKDLTLETYIKQVETWNDINEDDPSNTKYQDFVEGLKTNKQIRGLPRFIAEHVLPNLDKKTGPDCEESSGTVRYQIWPHLDRKD